jgi:hypothetical protein
MNENNTMIRDADGRYWLQTTDADGRRRSSYLGNIGQASTVEAWCLGRGIEFRQVSSAPGRKVRIGVKYSPVAQVPGTFKPLVCAR